ncbi:MAG: homoserine dehydrogenase [SAR324 cluster bacterium]|nr:homoserine dehydrogenase [SAR324 cluster bacterium]MDP6744016.1 homoserine dehydrogenase [SAR324 cluster bacterium]MDP7046448.1 homoserine dehydrogenase [SAR324 cluster bacterium]MEC8940595.1 homoserine dehydrogenase [SAR324 cluster bacterium]MEC8981299.1 homoserine dehydrogenase [SAR324 cluster bacterium]
MPVLNVAIAGFGTIGSGVAHVLAQHSEHPDAKLNLAGILERDTQGKFVRSWFENNPELFYESPEKLLEDPEVDVIVETIGGDGFARELITKALENGKHVITANKDLIAVHGAELMEVAQENGRHLLFEAAVAGAIPVLRLLKDYLQVQDIQGIRAILNGTTNYILSEMESNDLSFEEALSQAQDLGFAEQDPTNDIEGIDARYKLVILTYLITGQWFAPEQISLEGIDHLELADFEYAERMGRRIKLIANLRLSAQEGVQVYVLPLMIKKDDILAKIAGSTNAVTLTGKYAEDITLIGKGAGSLPTASAIVSDLNKVQSHPEPFPPPAASRKLAIKSMDEINFRHTLRFEVRDHPGIFGHYGKIFERLSINIYALEQLPQYHRIGKEGEETVIFTLTLQNCKEGLVQKALEEINQADYMLKPVVLLREIV